MQWWKARLRPEIVRNFEYLDGFDYDGASLLELAVLLEDAIDIHDRHWKIHWMLNFAQFASTQNLNTVIEEVGADTAVMGRLQSSVEDRNWDAIEDLWRARREVMEGVQGENREKLTRALELSLGMNPLTPDHHFFVDQGTNARLRIAAIAIGRKLAHAGVLDDPEDTVFLRYNELRRLMAEPG